MDTCFDRSMSTTRSSSKQHVAVLAFPFGSHGLTIFNLMLKLSCAAPNLQFSFLSTKKYNENLSLSSKLANNNVRFYDVDDGLSLSEDQHNPLELFIAKTPHNFQKGLDTAMVETGQNITCLITDAFWTFASEMAETMDIAWIPVFVATPYNVSAHFYTHRIHQLYIVDDNGGMKLDKDQTLDMIPGLSVIRVADLSDEILMGDSRQSLFSSMLSKIGSVLPKASAIIMNCFQELYSIPLLDDFKTMLPNVLNVGFFTQPLPLPPLPLSELDTTGCLSWLDRQSVQSVVYISFGTVATPPYDELVALAEALVETKTPFLWSLRDDGLKSLPNFFMKRVSEHGKIVRWVPQTEVLAHPSIRVFLTHCGANSLFESIANGVPMICRPFFGDQHMNGRVVEEVWEIGVNLEGLVFTKGGVIKGLEIIFSDGKGKKIRENVQALREIVLKATGPNGSATKDFTTLVKKICRSSSINEN